MQIPARIYAPNTWAERWQSGLTRTPGKREYPKGIGGSNPPLSASLDFYEIWDKPVKIVLPFISPDIIRSFFGEAIC